MTQDLQGLVPDALAPAARKIFLHGFELPVDIGFHDFEVGSPQRLIVNVEVWLDEGAFPTSDEIDAAWNYDVLRTRILAIAGARRFNLQETLCRAIYDMVAARRGVTGLTVSTCKPDIYPDCAAVGVQLSSATPGARV